MATFKEIHAAKIAALGAAPARIMKYHAVKNGKVTTFDNRDDAYAFSNIVEVESNTVEINSYRRALFALHTEALNEFKGIAFSGYPEFPNDHKEMVWNKAREYNHDSWDSTRETFDDLMEMVKTVSGK
jgi:hypothetical protein